MKIVKYIRVIIKKDMIGAIPTIEKSALWKLSQLMILIGRYIMILCSKDCYPCCDFCYWAIHDIFYSGDEKIIGEPIGCKRYDDEGHQYLAQNFSYCGSFLCYNANKELNKWIMVEWVVLEVDVNF